MCNIEDKHLNRKVGKEQKRQFTGEIYTGNREIKSMSSVIKEMQISATLRYHLWNIRLAKTKKNGNAKQARTRGTNTLKLGGGHVKWNNLSKGNLAHILKAVDLEIWLLSFYLKNVGMTLVLILKN